jgi:hypothetical protein
VTFFHVAWSLRWLEVVGRLASMEKGLMEVGFTDMQARSILIAAFGVDNCRRALGMDGPSFGLFL